MAGDARSGVVFVIDEVYSGPKAGSTGELGSGGGEPESPRAREPGRLAGESRVRHGGRGATNSTNRPKVQPPSPSHTASPPLSSHTLLPLLLPTTAATQPGPLDKRRGTRSEDQRIRGSEGDCGWSGVRPSPEKIEAAQGSMGKGKAKRSFVTINLTPQTVNRRATLVPAQVPRAE